MLLIQRKKYREAAKAAAFCSERRILSSNKYPTTGPLRFRHLLRDGRENTWVRSKGQGIPGFFLSTTWGCWAFGLGPWALWNEIVNFIPSIPWRKNSHDFDSCPVLWKSLLVSWMLTLCFQNLLAWNNMLGLRQVGQKKNNSKYSTSDHWTLLK